MSLAGVLLAELLLFLFAPNGTGMQLLYAVLGFAVTYLLSLLLPQVRAEVLSVKSLLLRPGPFRRLVTAKGLQLFLLPSFAGKLRSAVVMKLPKVPPTSSVMGSSPYLVHVVKVFFL